MEEKTVAEHFGELKTQFKSVLFIYLGLITVFYLVSDAIILHITRKFGLDLVSIHPFEVFMTKLNLAFFIATAFSVPLLFYKTVKYFKPGLTEQEYNIVSKFIPVSILFSGVGVVFGYYLVAELATGWFQGLATSTGVTNTWTVSNVVGFISRISVASAIIFNIPVVVMATVKAGLIKASTFKQGRPHMTVFSVIVSAIISPPDLMSMFLIAVPMLILYEGGVLLSKII